MGAACCCFHVAEPEDDLNASNNGSFSCFGCFIHSICNKYTTLFGGNQRQTLPPNTQAPVSNAPINNTQSETIISLPRIFPFDADADSQENGADALHPLHFHISLRFNSKDLNCEDEDEDEDVCPTCLEGYTTENPRIATKCSHHFHLSCIYEWMERKPTCPVCSKEMKFEEL